MLTESQQTGRSRREHRFRTQPLFVRAIGNLPLGLVFSDLLSILLVACLITPPVPVLVTFTVILVTCRTVGRVYRQRFGLSWVNELPRNLATLLTAAVLTLTVVWPLTDIPAIEVISLAGAVGVVAALLQLLATLAARRARRRWGLGRRTVIVGDGPVATRLATLMRTHRDFGMTPVAVLELYNRTRPEPLAKLVRRHHAEVVVLAFSLVREAEVLDEVIHATRSGVTLFVVPRLFEVHHDGIDVERLFGYPMVRFRRDPTTQPQWWLKRLADILAAAVLLVLTSPLIALGMLLVYIDTGRPIFFRQVRLGRDAKPITIFKLRSLRPVPQSQSDSTWDINLDDRVSPIGRFLRRTSMDELPQLFNILRGDMSFVGPRPERPGFVRQFSQTHARYWARHRVPVGLTGLAQVSGLRGDTSIEDRARFDNYYIANWSLWLDAKIFIQTVREVFFPARVREDRPWAVGRPTILHVAQPTTAGVAQVVLDLVRDQVERGWDVHVACPAGSGWLMQAVTEAGANGHVWEAQRQPGRSIPREMRDLSETLTEVDPDLIHLHSAKAGLVGRLTLRGTRPTVFQPHAWSFEAVTGRLRAASLNWERLAVRWTDVTLCVSQGELRLGRRMRTLGRRALVVSNGVDLERFRRDDWAAARLDLQLPEISAPLVVCVGRVDEQKGQDLLVTAWDQIRAEHPQARLAIVGDGPKLDDLREQAPAGVHLAGFSAQVPTWLAAADVVAIPSRWEGMPLLILEAMASARPVVAFDVNGIRECLGDVGTLVPPGDVDAMARAISAYLGDPATARRDGLRLRERAERYFPLSKVGDGVAAVVRGLTVVDGQRPLEIDLRTVPQTTLPDPVNERTDTPGAAGS